ncbi:MAG: hypothetical protein M1813_002557 [Trichoglossum hirsutum]|nr:MAG: hypothetical protein M1813_002557 [Trichoglossum hirsutum]
MGSPKNALEQYSSPLDINFQFHEDSGGSGPSKRRKIVEEAKPSGVSLGNEYAVLMKEETDNEENIGLESRAAVVQGIASHPGGIEVIDLLDDEDGSEAEAQPTKQEVASRQEGIAQCGNVPPRGIMAKSISNDKKVDEEDELNEAAYRVMRSAMADLNDDETSWMDQIIHSRPSANGTANSLGVDAHGNVQLTREELMDYLSNLENRPGHVKRRRRLMKAKDLHREDGEAKPLPETRASARPEPGRQEVDLDGNKEENEDGAEDVDPIQEEKDRVIEAARRLGCKRKRKLITRLEGIPDDTTPDSQETESTAGAEVKSKPREIVIIAEGPDGHPRRYRRVKELKSFWTIPGMTTPLLDHQILGVDWMVNDKELAEKGLRGGLVADMMGLGKVS